MGKPADPGPRIPRISDHTLSIGQEHELLIAFKKAGISPAEVQEIVRNAELARKLVDITSEAAKDKKAQYERLFDNQIATLKDRGVPQQIVEIFQGQKSNVLEKANDLPAGRQGCFGDGNIPFLPVIPRSIRGPHDLMAMVRNGGKAGYTHLNPTQISDVVDAPQEPYYIYDVEDGSSTRGKSPENAEKILKQQMRSPLTAAEVMALTAHTDVLSRHCVYATGSSYNYFIEGVPGVCLNFDDDRPGLYWNAVEISSDRWGSGSCLR